MVRRRFIRLNAGERVVTAYLLFAYAIPLIGNILFADSIQSAFKIYPPTWYSVSLMVMVWLAFLILSSLKMAVFSGIQRCTCP